MYRLIFCDLDGTIVPFDRRDREVSPAVREAAQAVADLGAFITISTGRGYASVRQQLEQMAVNAPLICCNGNLIIDPVSGRVLDTMPMPLPLAHELLQMVQAENLMTWIGLADVETILENRSQPGQFVVRRDGEILRNVSDPFAELTESPLTLVIVPQTAELTPGLVAQVQQHVGQRARVMASGPRWIEVLAPGASKARATSWVAATLGVNREETMAIGDGNNDIEMLEWAGLGVAMGNATAEVKAVADWVAPTVEEDGLAVALRRFVLRS